jgi:hypothetical protein
VKYPVTAAVALAPRKRPLFHPWNRGYPNNKRLREIQQQQQEQERKTNDTQTGTEDRAARG